MFIFYTQGSPFYRSLECDKWEDGNNAIVKIAREISQQLQDMTAFTKRLGPIGVCKVIQSLFFKPHVSNPVKVQSAQYLNGTNRTHVKFLR
jgi:hypothetical protein